MKQRLLQWLQRMRHPRDPYDLEDELRVHLDLQREDNLALGYSSLEAERLANLRLGNPGSIVEKTMELDVATFFETWWRDLVVGFRSLRKNPVFAAIAVLTIAVGIGANSAVFSLLYGLLLRSLPVPAPQRLARIEITSPKMDHEQAGSYVTYGNFQQFQREQHSYENLSAWFRTAVTARDGEGTLRLYNTSFSSGSSFRVLGLKPVLGRLFFASDDRPAAPAQGWPAVISYALWASQFASDPHVVGKSLSIQNLPAFVAGVLPSDFTGPWPGWEPAIYLPLHAAATLNPRLNLNRPDSTIMCSVIARLRPDISFAQAKAELAVRGPQLIGSLPTGLLHSPFLEHASLQVKSAHTGFPNDFHSYEAPLLLLQGLVAVVLLLCCVNVAGLLMSKIYSRQHEFAVRAAIGGSRWRLARQHITESLLLALSGALLASLISPYISKSALVFFRSPNMFDALSIHTDKSVFLITGVLAILVTVFAGTLPALRIGRANPGSLLRSRNTLGGRQRILGRLFVPAQVALSLVLIAIAALLSQSLSHLRSSHLGFDAAHVTIQTPPFDHLPQRANGRLDIYQRMVERIQQFPGVYSAAVTYYTPLTGSLSSADFRTIGTAGTRQPDVHLAFNSVGSGYFRTMKTALVAGREFIPQERSYDVCILNQSAASVLFPHQSSIGRYVATAPVTGTRDDSVPMVAGCRVIGTVEEPSSQICAMLPHRRSIFLLHLSSSTKRSISFSLSTPTPRRRLSLPTRSR